MTSTLLALRPGDSHRGHALVPFVADVDASSPEAVCPFGAELAFPPGRTGTGPRCARPDALASLRAVLAMPPSCQDLPATWATGEASPQGDDAPWRAVESGLSAVVGPRGAAAILRQALVTARRTHGWMPELPEDASFDAGMRALDQAVAARRPAEASAGRHALETTFDALLSSFVGAALAARLLRGRRTLLIRGGAAP